MRKLQLQLHFLICQNLNCNHFGADSSIFSTAGSYGNAFEHSYTVESGNRLRVGAHMLKTRRSRRKRARFRGKWGLGAPPPKFPVHTPGPSPPPLLEDPPPLDFQVNPPPRPLAPPEERGGGRGVGGGGGGAEAPFTAKTSRFFGENALNASVSGFACRPF